MRMNLYRWMLRLPGFRGAGRIQEMFRSLFFPRPSARVVRGLEMELDPWEWTQIDILKNGHTEPETLKLFEEILRPGDVYYDVGAHVGFHALVARSLVGPGGKVVAIDPQPYNCEKILRNSEINEFSNVEVVIAAAGNRSAGVMLHEQGVRDKARLSIVLPSMNDRPLKFRVPMIRLDDLLDERGDRDVRLLKVDVEGYESMVLEGAGSRLDCVCNVILELLPECRETAETEMMLTRLVDAGFELRNIRGEPWTSESRLPENNLWAVRVGGYASALRD